MNSRKTTFAVLTASALLTACGGKDDPGPPPPAMNQPPVISAITNKTADQDTAVGPIQFGVADGQTDAAQLTVTAAADGNGLFPADGVVLGGSGTARTLTLMPLDAATGMATVVITVTDPQGLASSRSFTVTVNARSASMREVALATFAKGENDEVTAVNGLTFAQDADDPAIFDPIIGAP
jgi:hypothetical protein